MANFILTHDWIITLIGFIIFSTLFLTMKYWLVSDKTYEAAAFAVVFFAGIGFVTVLRDLILWICK